MKKSRAVTLTIMTSLAAACADGRTQSDGTVTFTAADTVRRCVDAELRVVSDSLCIQPDAGAASGTRTGDSTSGTGRTGGGFYPYFFYFGGSTLNRGGATYVAGGSRTMPSIRGPVTRGGIGATSRARAGAVGA